MPFLRIGATQRTGAVLKLALPATAELLLNMVVDMVNTYLVGHLGAASLAGVGLASQWVMTAMVLFSAVGTGATALIARMVGAREWPSANRVLGQAVAISFVIGLGAAAALWLAAEPALALLGAEEEAIAQGVPYLRLVSSVFMFSALMFIGNACLRGAGDTRTPLLVMTVVNLINLGLSWPLVNGLWGLPRLGVEGAAIGALSGRLAGGLLVMALLLKGRDGLILKARGWSFDPGLSWRMLRIGLPAALEQFVFRMGMLAFVRTVSALGTASYAAHQVALSAESISFMPGFGFAVAATTLVGQGLGAQDPRRAEQDGFAAFYLAAALMSVMGVGFILFAPQLMGVFTEDPQIIELGTTPLRLIGLAQPFLAAMMVFGGGLRGAGETTAPLLINGLGVWVVRVPAALFFTRVLPWGLTGAWIAMALDLTSRGLLLLYRFRSGKWKTVQV
ncbi:MAG: MATE family efflux transporter [Candidatus Latescibacteria bacterium]|nr:MATE family efflux transporter [Candidatus Latescibacterota bacterium]